MPDNPTASPETSPPRASSQPVFWDERYRAHDRLFGTDPDPFLADALRSLSSGASVLDVGGGDGRNTLPLARRHGFDVTVLDFAPHALDTAMAYATAQGLAATALHADVRTWVPQRRYDAAVVAFVQLLPSERTRLYDQLRDAVRPGGAIIGLWFRDGHGSDAYDRIGPSKSDRYVHRQEIRRAFAADTVHTCAPVDRTVQQGPVLRGHAALLQAQVRRGSAPDSGRRCSG